MGRLDKVTEIIPGAKTARGRIHAQRLIAPTAVKRMLIDGQQFDMGKPHLFHVRHQLLSQLFVAEPEVVVGMAAPRSQVNFVNRNRLVEAIGRFTGL